MRAAACVREALTDIPRPLCSCCSAWCGSAGREMYLRKNPCVIRSESIPLISLRLCLKHSLSTSQGQLLIGRCSLLFSFLILRFDRFALNLELFYRSPIPDSMTLFHMGKTADNSTGSHSFPAPPKLQPDTANLFSRAEQLPPLSPDNKKYCRLKSRL